MEKKVPERKVSLQEGDIFYVYDKRINKCVKEDCNGTVKYGLILKVSMTKDESCNCFECNKCHMKYTPYPNYVRLTETKNLTIYNQPEVTARDEKRAEDARKQALREKKEQKQKFGNKASGGNKAGAKKRGNIIIAGDSKKFGSYYKSKSFDTKNSRNSNDNNKDGFKRKPYKSYNSGYKKNYNSHQD